MPAADKFASNASGLTSPLTRGEAVTPHNTNELTNVSRALWIGGAGSGNLKVTTVDGSELTFAGVPAGTLLPVRAKIVWATGTDVTNILALD